MTKFSLKLKGNGYLHYSNVYLMGDIALNLVNKVLTARMNVHEMTTHPSDTVPDGIFAFPCPFNHPSGFFPFFN